MKTFLACLSASDPQDDQLETARQENSKDSENNDDEPDEHLKTRKVIDIFKKTI